MKKIKYYIGIFLLFFMSGFVQSQSYKSWSDKVGAKSFPKKEKTYWVNSYGAVSDTVTLNTNAIQKAIDACSKNGGGIVAFKSGTYVMGSIFLKSNVHLRIDKKVTLLGSQHFSDYKDINTRIAGIEMEWPAALINVIDATNAAVTGEGVVNGRGKFCWDKYWKMRKQEYEPKGLRWIVDYDAKRVRTILVQNSSDITLSKVTLKNAGFWTVQLLYSTRVTVDGLVIRNNEDGVGPSTDGIDIDSSSWVLVENCDIDCNDDDFCLKAGRDWDGLRVNRPTEYVVIRNSIARKGGGLLTLGSETSGSIRHVLATGLTALGTGNGFHIKSASTRGGVVSDIWFVNNQLDSVVNAFNFTMNWNPTYSYSTLPAGYVYDSLPAHWKVMLQKVVPESKGIPVFQDIHIEDINAKGVKKIITANGMEGSYLENFNFKNVHIKAQLKGDLNFVKNWVFDDAVFESADAKPLVVKNSISIGDIK
jgi:polygalacturonase